MYQSFEVTARPEQGPPRLKALRAELAAQGLDGFLVPRADVHQGEYVSPRDERLVWLTGFTGSAGFCAVLHDVAGVFIDGRYRTQIKTQVADVYTPVPWPETGLADWLIEQMPAGGVIGFDPWLHTAGQIEQLTEALTGTGITLKPTDNMVDAIWDDQPAPAMAPAKVHPLEFAGESHEAKRARLGTELSRAGQTAAIITLPDSLCWLLNIRGADIHCNPVAQGLAILHADARVDLFMADAKLNEVRDHLGPDVTARDPDTFLNYLSGLTGPVRMEKTSVPAIVADTVGSNGTWGDDPCALPKACKNTAEIEGSASAHLRDGAAVVELLAWLDAQAPGTVTETQVVTKLEACRRSDNALQDISFDTISGTGPNGAINHYHVNEATDLTLKEGHLLVLDSGGQYLDGTTDITRTIPIGKPGADECAAFTRVLMGMIAVSRLRWPAGLAGRDIEAIGRAPLWYAHQDFDHGLGHGVGAYLSVHEGPQRLSRASHVPLKPGMILSNEPGYYREGAFGIRLENLLVVEPATAPEGGDAHRAMLSWRTLTFVPIDRRLILPEQMDTPSRDWLNAYHAEVLDKIGPRVSADTLEWLKNATASI
ncbi:MULTISPECIES: aminopeptidase P family protein [Roseobacteraceae]|uniref:Putative dipeptidase PepE n=1 Tax=Pseudosulfitobacter pseudonitzschiae TaxID=1402135 RepID=A0A221K166_9RHOB|nr:MULTISPECIES: aminopeptidase P family protein [Roseobacteraceae]ASM72735.1 putative dipeptidase PepE [Pseudosulfitobacter pseudonitzschiae]